MAVIAAALALLLAQYTRNSVLQEAAEEAQHTLSVRVASRLSPEDFQQPMKGERYTRFDQFVTESVVSARTARVKLWNREGVLIYSTDPVQVGERFPIKAELQAALNGGVGRGWFTITRQRRRLEQDTREPRGLNRLLQGHLSQRLHVLEDMEGLRRDMAQRPAGPQEWKHYCERMGRLIGEAAAPPTSPIEHTEPGPGSA